MMSFARSAPVLVLAALGLAGPVAAEVVPGVTAAGIQLGPRVCGPEVAAGSLAHRVVLLEFWGVDCPPCLASMPALQKLHEQFGPAGLSVIGAHAQGGPAERVAETAQKLGVTFPIVEHANVDGAMDFAGIPHCMLFDHTGACIFRGSPFDVHDLVVAAVRAAPASVLGGRTLEKLPELDALLRDESTFGAALKRAQGATSAKDEATAAEATFVVERLEARGRELLADANGMASSDPLAASVAAQRCATAFKGTPLAVEANLLLAGWRKDKDFQAACRAGQQLARLEAMRAYVRRSLGGEAEITPEVAAALPPAMRRQMEEAVRGVKRAGPESPYAAKADAIALEFGLAAPAP